MIDAIPAKKTDDSGVEGLPKGFQSCAKRIYQKDLPLFQKLYLELRVAFPEAEISEAEVFHLALKSLEDSGGALRAYLSPEALQKIERMESVAS